MKFKGAYDPSVSYDVGDTVVFGEAGYVLKEPCAAGTPPTVDLYWRRLDQDLWAVVDMILDVVVPNVSDDAIVLKGTDDAEYLITVDDSGEEPELAVTAIE